MNRFKFHKKDFKSAIEYIKSKKGTPPNWAKKDGLSIKGSKIFYNELEIVAEEDVDDYLRKTIYDKEATTPFGRDSAFHIIKSKVLGVPRRKIMEFLRKQKSLGETRSALPKPKRKMGPKLGRPTFECDLVFIRKDDLINSNPMFDSSKVKEETYICSCVEKTTGMCKLDFVKTKEQNIVTPIVEKQIKWLCKRLKLDPKRCSLRMDKGGEFSVAKLTELVPDTKTVPTGTSIEKKNQQLQSCFYRLLKNRQASSIKGAVRRSQKLCNQTINKYHKKTPNEMADDPETNMKEVLKKYNKTRQSYIKGDKRKPFTVGQHVRIQIKDPKADQFYKSYKNKTFTERVFVISKVTKKANPPKYFVNGRWYLQDLLLKSSPRDKKSEELIKTRDAEKKVVLAKKHVKKETARLKEMKKQDVAKKKLYDQNKLPNVRQASVEKLRQKLLERRKESAEIKKQIDEAEEKYQKKRKHVGKKKRIKIFSQKAKDDDYVPSKEDWEDMET
jgi:hypothetical protein